MIENIPMHSSAVHIYLLNSICNLDVRERLLLTSRHTKWSHSVVAPEELGD